MKVGQKNCPIKNFLLSVRTSFSKEKMHSSNIFFLADFDCFISYFKSTVVFALPDSDACAPFSCVFKRF